MATNMLKFLPELSQEEIKVICTILRVSVDTFPLSNAQDIIKRVLIDKTFGECACSACYFLKQQKTKEKIMRWAEELGIPK